MTHPTPTERLSTERLEEILADHIDAPKALSDRISIYTVDGDDGIIHLSAFGTKLARFAEDSPQGIALLKLEAEIQTRRAQEREAVGVVVKPMKWPAECKRGKRVVAGDLLIYVIVHYGGDGPETVYRWAADGGAGWSQAFQTYDEAKAAAQADYERRIRSALVSAPAAEPVAWRVEWPKEGLLEHFSNEKTARAMEAGGATVTPLYAAPLAQPEREGE